MKVKYKESKITVLGMEVDVIYEPIVMDDGDRCNGLWIPSKRQIRVATQDCTEYEIKSSFFHEVGHSIIYRLGLRHIGLSSVVEEILCEGFGNFMADNY